MNKSETNTLVIGDDPLSPDVRKNIELLDYYYKVKLAAIPIEIAAKLDNTPAFSRNTQFVIREYIESFLVSELAAKGEISIKMAGIEWGLMKGYTDRANQVVEDTYERIRKNRKGSSLTLKEMSLETQKAFCEMKRGAEMTVLGMSQEMQECLPISIIGIDIIKMMCLTHQAKLTYEETNIKGYENVAMVSIIKAILCNWLYPQDSELKYKVKPNIPISLNEITPDLQIVIDRDLKEYHTIRREEIEKFASYLKLNIEDSENPQDEEKR